MPGWYIQAFGWYGVILCVSRAAQSPQGEGSKGTFPVGFGSLIVSHFGGVGKMLFSAFQC